YELVSSSVSSNNYFGKTLFGISIIKDNWYSVSVDVKEDSGTSAYFNVCMNEGTGAVEHIAPINYEIPYGGLYAATTEWQTYNLLFKATSSVTTGSIGIQINDPSKTLQIRNIILNKINFVDDCQTDNTADWTRIGSNGTLTYEMEDIGGGLFDTHYLFSTSTTVSLPNYSLANGFAKTNLTFLKGKYYKISCYVKDGTATGVSIKLRISPWGGLPFSSDAIVTNGTWQKLEYYYYVFTDNYESGSVGFYSRISLGGGNIKIKDFRFHEVSSFEYFSNKFDELSLSFNGGFFAIEDRIKILSSVLIQCGCILRVTDKIELWQLDNRLKTIYDYQIRSKGEGQESTFNYRQNEKDFYDYGYVAFPEADSPQMILKQKGIFIDQDKIAEPISSLTVLKDVIEIPHVSDSENAQKAGIVYLQRKNGVEETITLDCRDDLLVTQPDDMVLFNDLEYGIRPVGEGSYNSYNLTVQQVHIKPDLTISLQLLKFIHPILNWDDLSVNVVTIETDDSPATTIYKTITAGPDDDTGQNKVDSRVRIGNNIILDGEKGLITIGEGLISRVWSFQTTEKEPNYSTAIGPYTVLDGTTPRKAILFCSQNWLFYALDVDTGEEIWSQINDGAMYGRMQAVDLEGTGDLKIYVPCNTGHIKRVDADGEYDSAFTFYNVYDREGSGTVTSVGAGYIIDSSQAWHDNAFIRISNPTTQAEADTNAEVSFTSGVANGSSARISLISSGNKLDLYGGVPAGVAPGDTFIINPAYVSDKIFMHAGQLIKEGSIWYLYATSQDSHIYKINAHTGTLIWKYAGLEATEACPWIGDLFQDSGQYVLWGCYDKHLRCHNATTGAVIWDVELDGLLDGTPQVAPTGTGGKYEIYQASRSGKIFKLDRDDGSILAESGRPQYWQDVASTTRPLKRSDNSWMVYIGGRRGDFGAYDCTDMYPIWKKNVTPDNINSSAVFHDVAGYGNLDIIIADMTGTIHIFHEDGMKICEVYGKGAIEGMPLIADIDDDGKVEMVVTTCDGWVHCFRFTNGTDNGVNGECPDVITMPLPPDV
ncbi:MAG: PQQ-binding-like beta-propeller repeat protein, partial [Melioribacteraceae bacterium]|nr:PQQ-binding-like beta-propeller repeat protein [Melioribacteraceae bacterium]